MFQMENGAMGKINMDFAMDDIQGVLAFMPSICAGEREQMFLVCPSSLLLPLPFLDSAAGSVSSPAVRLSPTQYLSWRRPRWEECPKRRGPPRFSPFLWVTSAACLIP